MTMNLFYLPTFANVVFSYLIPIGLVLLTVYLVSAFKGLSGSKVFIDTTRLFHYAVLFFTTALSFSGLAYGVQGLVNIYTNNLSKFSEIEGVPADIDLTKYIKLDINDSLGLVVAALVFFVYSYWRLRKMRLIDKNNAHDSFLNKLYLSGILFFLGLFILAPAFALVSTLVSYFNSSPDEAFDFASLTTHSLLKNAPSLILALIVGGFKAWKLRRLGENI